MNDLNKILGIYDVKINVNCVKDDTTSALLQHNKWNCKYFVIYWKL